MSNKIKVLVVDDLLTMRNLLIKSLNSLGFVDIMQAQDGNQAMAGSVRLKLSTGPPAIVLSAARRRTSPSSTAG